MRGARVVAGPSLLALLAAVATACGKKAGTGVLQAEDLSTTDDGPFDPTEIVDPTAFTDFSGLDQQEIQALLDHTPYNEPSFLSTYQSHGVLAAEAIARAAVTYRINPLVFLVRAQMDQGLIGLQTYPSPTSRVEYTFGCGVLSQGQFDPALAGFDIQCDCLGAALRASLDQIAQVGQTAGGWGPGIASMTLDGYTLTPQDASTAALYQYDPEVDIGTSGAWLFWSVWNEYATALDYAEPIGIASGIGMASIGDACSAPTDCADPGAICATGEMYPGGLCTLPCTGDCPSDRVETFCGDFVSSGFCLAVCNPSSPMPCRSGYECITVHQYMSSDPNDGQSVCFHH